MSLVEAPKSLWKCWSCGIPLEGETSICDECGTPAIPMHPTPKTKVAFCQPGNFDPAAYESKSELPGSGDYIAKCCICGETARWQNSYDNKHGTCPSCGAKGAYPFPVMLEEIDKIPRSFSFKEIMLKNPYRFSTISKKMKNEFHAINSKE